MGINLQDYGFLLLLDLSWQRQVALFPTLRFSDSLARDPLGDFNIIG